jgi:hypothetical protein
VGARGVVVRQVGGEDTLKVAAVPDQSPVEALGPDALSNVGGAKAAASAPRRQFDQASRLILRQLQR